MMRSSGNDNHLIFIADDEADVLATFQIVLKRAGYAVVGFPDGVSLLENIRHAKPACILLDVKMPGMSGLAVLKALVGGGYDGPIIMISGVGDIPMAMEAVHSGAWDFFEKPLDADKMVEMISNSIAGWKACRGGAAQPQLRPFPGRELLTSREIDVLNHVVAGATSKEVARALGISWRTVECHRSRILDKTGAKNVPELIGLVLRAPAVRPETNAGT